MKAEIYTKTDCPFCVQAKQFLSGLDISYVEHTLMSSGRVADVDNRLKEKNTVPQIFIDNQYVGGYDDLVEWALNE